MATTAGAAHRFHVGEGEEARLTPGSAFAAEIRSRGPLPLRVRARGAAPRAAGLSRHGGRDRRGDVRGRRRDRSRPEARLRSSTACGPGTAGEIFRDRVVYGPAFVRAVEAERRDARLRARVRPWRFLLYPVVGLLPEEQQARICDRLGLYAVTATLVSGLFESAVVLAVLVLVGRNAEAGMAIALVVTAPGLVLFVLPGLGRAFAAALLQETGGSPVVNGLVRALRAAGALAERPPAGFVPLTRAGVLGAARLPRDAGARRDGGLLLSATLPHLGWDASRRLEAGSDYWRRRAAVAPSRGPAARLRLPHRPARRSRGARRAGPGCTRADGLRRRGAGRRAPRVGRVQLGLRLAHEPARVGRAVARVRAPWRPGGGAAGHSGDGGGERGARRLPAAASCPGHRATRWRRRSLWPVCCCWPTPRGAGARLAARVTRRACCAGCCRRTCCGPSAWRSTPTATPSATRCAACAARDLQASSAARAGRPRR